jgi:hypothetical protein
MKIYLVIFGLFVLLSCKKEETPSINLVAQKCPNSTLLDELLSGKQLYLETKVGTNSVLLNLKDGKGKARIVLKGVVNGIYEWDIIEIASLSPTKVTLKAGEIRAIQGNFVAGYYFPDTFFFDDDNCKVSGTSNDGQIPDIKPILYENITNTKDLVAILERYGY